MYTTAEIGEVTLAERMGRIGRNWGSVLALGIFYLLIGIVAFGWPFLSTLGLTFMLGIVLVASGIAQIVHAIQFRKETGHGWRIVQAVLALAAGGLMLRFPGAGMAGLAIAMSIYFFGSAFMKWMVAAGMRPHSGWGWAVLSGTASFILGVYMVATFPISALWVPGTILGIDLFILGVSLIGISFSLRNTHRRLQKAPEAPVPEERRAA